MNRKIFLICGAIFFICNSIGFAEEKITITTYYPSPYGSYNKLEAKELTVESFLFKEGKDGLIAFDDTNSSYTERLRITAGRHDGIGNTQGAAIDLHGNNRTQDTVFGGELHLVAGAGSGKDYGGPILFYAGNLVGERMRIVGNTNATTSVGNVGIGTSNPGTRLEVNNAIFYTREFSNSGGVSANYLINWTNGNKQSFTPGKATTLTFSAPTSRTANLVLRIAQPAASYYNVTIANVTNNVVKWSGGSAPVVTAANGAVDIFCFYFDGTTYYGEASLDFK